MLDPVSLTLVIATAVVAGVLAGLLGIGGGTVIVPALLLVFGRAGVDPAVKVQLAVGTSLATIVFTSISSAWSHHRKGALHFKLALGFLPGLILGSVAGVLVAVQISGDLLQLLFGIFLYGVAGRMVFGSLPESPEPRAMGFWTRMLAGLIIGGVSTMVGIGGGVLSVPIFVLAAGLTIHHAVGTSPALGLVLSLVGTIVFVMRGLGEPALPEGTVGYVASVPAAVITAGTVTLAPVGAWLAHRTPRRALAFGFALLLAVVATKLVLDASGVRPARAPDVEVQLQGYADRVDDGMGQWVTVYRQGSPLLMMVAPADERWEAMPLDLAVAAWVVAPSLDSMTGERRPFLVRFPSCLAASCEVGADLTQGALTAAVPTGRDGIPQDSVFDVAVAAWSPADDEVEAWIERHAGSARYPDAVRRGVWLERRQVVVTADGRWGDETAGEDSAAEAARRLVDGDHAGAAELLEAAAAEASGRPVHAAGWLRDAALAWSRGSEPDRAVAAARDALALDESVDDLVGQALDHRILGALYRRDGAMLRALDELGTAAGCWRRLGRHGEEAEALVELAAAYRAMGLYGNALDSMDRALPWLESSMGGSTSAAWADHQQLMAITQLRARRLGQRDVPAPDVAAALSEAHALHSRDAVGPQVVRDLLGLAELAIQEGDHALAAEHLAAARGMVRREADLRDHCRSVEVELALARGDGEAAGRLLRDSDLQPAWWWDGLRARALAHQGDTDAAREAFEAAAVGAVEQRSPSDVPVRQPWVLGDPDEVLGWYVASLAEAGAGERALEVTEMQRARRRVLERGGDADPRDAAAGVLEALAAALPPRSVALVYHVTADQVIVLAVCDGSLSVHRHAVDRVDVDALVQWHRDNIADGGDGRAKPELVPTILPPDLDLAGVETLLFVPHGPLQDVPFPVIDYGEQFLAQEHDVVLAPCAADFVAARQRSARDGRSVWIIDEDSPVTPELAMREATTVVARRWAVDEEVAAFVEERLEGEIEQHGAGAALRRVQAALMAGEAGEAGQLARSWGAWVVYGEME